MPRLRRWGVAAASAATVAVIWPLGAVYLFFSIETNFGWITPLMP